MKTLIKISAIILLSSCGSSSNEPSSDSKFSKEGSSPINSMALESSEDLPECTEEHETQLAYLKDEKVFKVCSEGEWAEIDIKGANGENGKDGENGEDGQDGQDARIVETMHCSFTISEANAQGVELTTDLGINASIGVYYSISRMLSNDVFSSATISWVNFDVSRSEYYASSQVGAQTASVLIGRDHSGLEAYGYWKITTAGIEYHDSGLGGDGVATWSFTADHCTVNSY